MQERLGAEMLFSRKIYFDVGIMCLYDKQTNKPADLKYFSPFLKLWWALKRFSDKQLNKRVFTCVFTINMTFKCICLLLFLFVCLFLVFISADYIMGVGTVWYERGKFHPLFKITSLDPPPIFTVRSQCISQSNPICCLIEAMLKSVKLHSMFLLLNCWFHAVRSQWADRAQAPQTMYI